MKIRILLLIITIPLFISCGKKTIFQERVKFDDLKWNRFKELSFTFEVQDTSAVNDIIFNFRHHSVYPYEELFITIALSSPSGERRISDYHIPVKKPDGSFFAEGMGDLWDLDYTLMPGHKFSEKGKYKLEIENRMSKLETPGVMEAGITVVQK